MNFKNSASGTSQSVEARQNDCNASPLYLEKEKLDPATYTFEVKGSQTIMDPLDADFEKAGRGWNESTYNKYQDSPAAGAAGHHKCQGKPAAEASGRTTAAICRTAAGTP